ncbi:MAG: hypothetical protein LC114_05780 [Bryobacterales bacterium]|nr:hypothetical protein [Bryobacterales bacterium]
MEGKPVDLQELEEGTIVIVMTAEATAIAKVLLRHHSQHCGAYEGVIPKSITDTTVAQCVIFYGSLCERAGVPFLTHGVGRFLGEIAEWCEENGWPPLNSLAVNRATGMPGVGYDGAPGSDLLHWPEQVRKCIVFDGYPETIA